MGSASAWKARPTSCPESEVDQHADPHSQSVAGQVAPQEAEAQDQPAERRPPDRVDPGGVIQLADLDATENAIARRATRRVEAPGKRTPNPRNAASAQSVSPA